ncbi:MAG TPA: FAD-linked oxidase C-terminal domain-containing protein [Thermoanaerobaculia bacterium]|nr:FAD-linked oxidase C-terminal domain-containing protein [Thermoanaerobaculia bacterium]
MSLPSRSQLTDADLARLESLLGPEAVRWDAASRERYGRDETEDFFFPPEVVVLPASTDEVAAVLRLASERRLPVTPRGAGTGLSGGALPVAGGILLSVERLNRIREVSVADQLAVAETGVVTGELQRRVEEQGLFYPPDPASRDTCLLAGNLAEDSAGPRSLKYGTTRAWVLGLEAVLADGTVVHAGGRTRKNAAGYSLTQLLVGSEGTLAVLTAATLRLTARPRATLTLLVPFPELEQAAAAVSGVLAAGLDPAACELVEEGALAAVGAVEPLPPALVGRAAFLLFELHGDGEDELLARAERLAEVTSALGGEEPMVALDAAEERRLWALRRKVGEAVKHRSVYKEVDAVVPRSKLAPLVRAARAAAARHGLEAICYGHAGDGNLHVNLLRGRCDPGEWQARRDAAEGELLREVVALGGTITGEHGVGWTQRRHLPTALDPATLALMRQLKATFDPLGILNPGKVFPEG